MVVALNITKFNYLNVPFAFLGMAILRLPLWLDGRCRFWKLMGCGKDAQVDQAPDYKHWAVLTAWDRQEDYDRFYKRNLVSRWFRCFGQEEFIVLLKPLSGHGKWSGKEPFIYTKDTEKERGKIAVITRAAIHFNKLKEFRKNVKRTGEAMRKADGFIMSAGVGENPLSDQATFSIWENLESMKKYAYQSFDHADVIKLTRQRKWYKEELFARFEILNISGTLNGQHYEL